MTRRRRQFSPEFKEEAIRMVLEGERTVASMAAVVSMRRLNELEEAGADLRDLALVLARSVTDTGERVSLDEVIAAFGHTRESLAALPDDE
ncbi:transposase [Nonomuraea sp. NPDC049129]|uniref:transposase n=1 Tax=Nonomuraea sp. NPDC049129 TaxID=3155272 RepID=UPI003411F620